MISSNPFITIRLDNKPKILHTLQKINLWPVSIYNSNLSFENPNTTYPLWNRPCLIFTKIYFKISVLVHFHNLRSILCKRQNWKRRKEMSAVILWPLPQWLNVHTGKHPYTIVSDLVVFSSPLVFTSTPFLQLLPWPHSECCQSAKLYHV